MIRRQSTSSQRGFSLIELLLVVAIMGIVAAMAAPRYGEALNRYRADATARRIAADITMAQARARTTSSSRTIVFDTDSSTYKMAGEKDLAVSTNTYSVDLSASPYFAKLSRVGFGGNTTLSFNGYGVPSGSGSILISVGATTRTVSIDADSAIPTVQ